jgi:UDP:flavonoid glycosyltransferase YjiC (YdhE family)
MYAGCPHLVLAAWLDLYTLAARAEWLGCGLQANKGVEPAISSSLLADAIVLILQDRDGEEGARMRCRAEELGKMCRKRRGDQVAAEAILNAVMCG